MPREMPVIRDPRPRFWGGPPLAWRNLIHARTRFFIALSAVSFAVTLIFVQLGFFGGVLKTATLVYDSLNFDILLISRKSLEATITQSFSRQRLYQAGGIDGVASVMPFYIAFKQWRNPETKLTRVMVVMGFNPRDKVFQIPEVYEYLSALQRQDTLLMSRSSRPEFGPKKIGLRTELGNRKIEVVGFFTMNASLRADGIVIMSDQNFMRLYRGRSLDDLSIGLISVKAGTDIDSLVQHLREILPGDVEVLSRREAEAKDQAYWVTSTSVGYIFSLGGIAAFIVGAVIVYQVLNADVTEHLHEYATLKAIGYSNLRLSVVVLQEAVILAVLGFIPAFFMGLALYQLTYIATKIPVYMTVSRGIIVFTITIVMCGTSSLITLRKLFFTDPADVF